MKRHLIPLLCIMVLLASSIACNIPTPEEPTEVPPPTEPETPTEVPTLTSEPPTPTEEPSPEPLVVIHHNDNFEIYSMDGTLVETRSASGLNVWSHSNQYQIVGDTIYYVDSGGSTLGGYVKRVTAAGPEDLNFTASASLANLTFAVSEDETKIAWANAHWGNSELWMADIDGGGAQIIQQSGPSTGFEDYMVLEVYRWTSDGDLVYVWQISGIGNLLFFGYSSLYKYSPATLETTPLSPIPASGSNMPCWSIVSDDASLAVGTCIPGGGMGEMRERDLVTGIETIFPILPGQQQSGAAAYSPSGDRLAYAFGERQGDLFVGGLAVRLVPGTDPYVLASAPDGYFHRTVWVDETRLLVQGSESDIAKTYLITISGILTPFADGELVGLMPQ